MSEAPGATPTDAPSLDDRIAAKMGFVKVEPEPEQPEATPAPEAEVTDESNEPELVVEEEPVAPEDFSWEIKHNGETQKITSREELTRRAQMGTDYEFKMQRLNGDQQRLQTMAQALRAQQTLSAQHLDALADVKAIEKQLAQYANVDWVAVANGPDPVAAWQGRMAFDQLRDQHARAMNRASQIAQPLQQASAHYDEQAQQLEMEKLRARVPEWKDETRYVKDSQSIREAMTKHYGFKNEEIGGPILSDHRVVSILRDAWKYREAISAKRSPTPAPKSAKPGTPAQPRSEQQKTADIKRGLHQPNLSKDQRKALENELVARKFGIK
jgi:hypothetical protein